MENHVFQDINEYFESMEYQLIPTDSMTVRMYATYQLENLYLINVIELSDQYVFDYERYQAYKELTRKQFSEVGAEKIYLLNLLLIDNPDVIYEDVNYGIIEDENFVDTHWIIDTTYYELVIPKKQIKHLIGLEYGISETIQHDSIPAYKSHEKNKTSYFSGILTLSILAVYMMMDFVGNVFVDEGFIRFGALESGVLFKTQEYWRLFTYYWVHANTLHLLLNATYIFYFGAKLEKYLKTWY